MIVYANSHREIGQWHVRFAAFVIHSNTALRSDETQDIGSCPANLPGDLSHRLFNPGLIPEIKAAAWCEIVFELIN